MIIQPGTVYSVSSNRVGIVWVLKNGNFENDYSSSDFTFISNSGYTADSGIYISHTSAGRLTLDFDSPRKYLYVRVKSYQYTTNNSYSFRIDNSYAGGTSTIANDGLIPYGSTATVTVTPLYCATPKCVRLSPVCAGTIAIGNYFGGYIVSDLYFSDYTYDYIYKD